MGTPQFALDGQPMGQFFTIALHPLFQLFDLFQRTYLSVILLLFSFYLKKNKVVFISIELMGGIARYQPSNKRLNALL